MHNPLNTAIDLIQKDSLKSGYGVEVEISDEHAKQINEVQRQTGSVRQSAEKLNDKSLRALFVLVRRLGLRLDLIANVEDPEAIKWALLISPQDASNVTARYVIPRCAAKASLQRDATALPRNGEAPTIPDLAGAMA